MSPRKRVRPNPVEGAAASDPAITPSQSTIASQSTGPPEAEGDTPTPLPTKTDGKSGLLQKVSKQAHKSRSWYGSWPRAPKSAASTYVAAESILGGTSQPSSRSDLSRYDTRKAGEPRGVNGSTETIPVPPKAADDSKVEDTGSKAKSDEENKAVDALAQTQPEGSKGDIAEPTPTEPPPLTKPPTVEGPAPRPSTASGWLGWFNTKDATVPEIIPETQPKPPVTEVSAPPQVSQEEAPPTKPDEKQAVVGPSWFPFWSNTGVADTTKAADDSEATHAAKNDPPKDGEDVVMTDAPPPTSPPESTSAGSTWAFWSRDTRPKTADKSSSPPEQGELAVIGEGSENHPKPATGVEVRDAPSEASSLRDVPVKESKESTTRKAKRLRPQSVDLDQKQQPRPTTPIQKGESSKQPSSSKTPVASKPLPPNLILPSFKSTYRMKDNPSILHQIAQLLLRTQQPAANHVFLSKELPKVKKAVAIGVHGLFPATYLRPMIGQPTGTSIKFANHCAEAIRRWVDLNGCGDCEIEKVALEGEGRIAERVENLWKLLLNWIDHIRNADLIILACHSQGVPVGIMLVAKLIELGIITTPRIGVCAMAGVSLGPFPDYKSGLGMLMGSASELWEFANPESEVSMRYEQALRVVLDYGVRITYMGSIDDQVVPLESAIYSPAHHPYIYRAVFIDGRIHAPDFIAHLVGFACKLRNLGVSDHGLIRELSIPLAGSLYSGEGHSRIYEDEQVYDLAVSHALETTNVGKVPCEIQKFGGLSNPNPYYLPWILRGILEEDFVKTELDTETGVLLKQFDDWKPVTKALKDVKYRLEAVRSRL